MARAEAPETPLYFNFATDVLDYWAQQRPDSPGLWWVDAAAETERQFSFRELAALSCRAASFLNASGIGKGERVLLMLPRVPQWWITMLALIRLGAVPVPATLLLTAREVAYRLANARVKAVVTGPEGVAKIGEQGGWIDLDRGLRQTSREWSGERTRSDDPGSLYFTSATTGEPKMVLHTQASYGLGHRLTGKLWLDLRPGDVHWNLSDLGWGKAAWSSFFGPWQMGACVFALDVRDRFDPSRALDALEHFPITTWCAPPTALRLIVRQDLSRRRFTHLRHCVTAGEPLNPEVLNLWRAATGLTLHEGYGQTETVVLVGNFRSLGHPVKGGSMGHQTPGFILAILDEELNPAPAGIEGEIAVRVRPDRPLGLFHGYWLNPEETARKFQSGWYLTGDRAIRDEEGYFWFVGRKDDVIKSSGYRIGPFEVESALIEHPAVLEAAVIGKPDTLRGQIVKACVVLRPGFQGDDALVVELQRHCKSLVAAYKYPREIEFLPELPKTTSGKTRRVALRETLGAQAGALVESGGSRQPT